MKTILLICLPVLAQPGGVLVLKNANVIDGLADQPLRNVTVVVKDSRIESIGTAAAPAGATEIDLGGRWVLPGWVDAHVHINDLRQARTALLSGVTTARSMGASHFSDIGIGELNRGGFADAPDMVAAGYHVRPQPAEEMFIDLPKLIDLRGRVAGTAAVRRMVRALLDRGVGVIKIMATERGGLPDTDPRQRVFTDEDLGAAVDEAATRRIPVAAHAHGDEGARAAVRAGVKSIEHGTYLSDDTLTLMKSRGTYFVPTIATVVDLVEPGGDYDNALLSIRGRGMLPRVRETSARAVKMGVRMVAGTDTGYGPASSRRMPDEIIELHRAGLSVLQAIQAATSTSAELLGVGGRTGAVKPGLEADLIVIERDPVADITALHDVLVVINNGKVAVNRLVR